MVDPVGCEDDEVVEVVTPYALEILGVTVSSYIGIPLLLDIGRDRV